MCYISGEYIYTVYLLGGLYDIFEGILITYIYTFFFLLN